MSAHESFALVASETGIVLTSSSSSGNSSSCSSGNSDESARVFAVVSACERFDLSPEVGASGGFESGLAGGGEEESIPFEEALEGGLSAGAKVIVGDVGVFATDVLGIAVVDGRPGGEDGEVSVEERSGFARTIGG